jgi:tRNA1(Val) A37 N6-methylase TrmN6
MLPKIEESTFYPPLVSYLQNIGFLSVGNVTVGEREPDILFKLDDASFVIEVKIGKVETILTKAVGQAYDYARRLNTKNVIILIYPERYRNESLVDFNIINRIALNEKISAFVFTEYWTEGLVIEPSKLFESLKQKISSKQVQIDFKTAVKLIETYAKDLNSVVYQIRTEELVAEVVDKLDLFSSIGEIKDEETAKKQVINLASFLLFNQLLFYHIYKERAKDSKLPELGEIKKTKDIQAYFDKITEIDYWSIYKVNILGHIPDKEPVINTLNNVIKAIKLLRAEYITHDLAGRFFHDLIPHEVRKVLAAFYTHPIAADLLADLIIDSWKSEVIDPSCGSGTLLVASYRRKQKLFENIHEDNLNKAHKKFIENDLTGIDIMPFASHMSAINLTMQNIQEKTNVIRIATQDSLDLTNSLKTLTFKRKGIKISPYTTSIQATLTEANVSIKRKRKGAVSPEGKGNPFYIKPVDVVIMNPPFTDREKMPEYMREKLKVSPLNSICGNQVNFWGYFLALADLLLKPNGKIGAVIPINIARGSATEKIRKFLIDNYHIKYIIKTTKDTAFSEGTAFKDVLFIAEKKKPTDNDRVNIVFLKKSFKTLTDNELSNLVSQLSNYQKNETGIESTPDFQLWQISTNFLREYTDNLMIFLRGDSVETRKEFLEFFELFKQKGKSKLRTLQKKEMLEGFHASPKGLSELVFITKNSEDRTAKNSIMTIEDENSDHISVKVQSTNSTFVLSKKLVRPAIKTITGLTEIDVTKQHDYIVTGNFSEFSQVLTLSKWKGSFNWGLVRTRLVDRESFVALQHRIRMNSPNTNIIALYSDIPFYTTHAFNIFKADKEEAKILTLYFNSVLGLLQFSTYSKETTEGYMEFMQSDLINVSVPDVKKLAEQDIENLSNLFDKLRKVKFGSLTSQLEMPTKERIELDSTFLKLFGFSEKEIRHWLSKLYQILLEDINEN